MRVKIYRPPLVGEDLSCVMFICRSVRKRDMSAARGVPAGREQKPCVSLWRHVLPGVHASVRVRWQDVPERVQPEAGGVQV